MRNDTQICSRPVAGVLSKVPQITAIFWAIKIISTGMGEALSDYLNFGLKLDKGLLLIGGLVILAAGLALQFSRRKHVPWIYWMVVSIISTYGTLIADVVIETFRLTFITSTLTFATILTVLLVSWQWTEKTLSIHSITSFRREAFYWATVVATFCLGTALGDLTSSTLHWGPLYSGFFFSGLILIPAVGSLYLGFNEIFAFWFAYILTRPLGASFADWLSSPSKFGGLNLGANWISLVATLFIVVCVASITVREQTSLKEA